MKIDEIASPSGADVYYDRLFRVVIEDHMTFLREHPQTSMIEVSSYLAYKYEGDFFGLLEQLNQPAQFHWIIMRMNKLTSPVYSENTINSVLVPAVDVIERIRSVFVNINKITN